MLAELSRRCAQCETLLVWRNDWIRTHFRAHGIELSAGEAHQMITSRLSTPPDRFAPEENTRDFQVVSGGLPSLPTRPSIGRLHW